MGIFPRVYSLSIPLGTTINKNGLCVRLTITALALARIYGVQVSAVGLIMGIEPIIDMFSTVCNCLGTLTSTLVVAAREGLLDRETYNA